MDIFKDKIRSCKNLNELFEIWKKKPVYETSYYDKDKKKDIQVKIDHSKAFIEDGPICQEIWDKETNGKRIMFLLKEAYGEDEGWSLSDWLKITGPSTALWYRIVEWTYGITNTSENTIARYSPSDISFDKLEEAPNEWLSRIAVMNIKKSNGKNTSNYSEIEIYARSDREELLKEIEIIDPDIIVCGSTAQALNSICEFMPLERNDNWYYITNKIGGRDRLIIDYYHPANRYPSLLNYYGLVGIYQQALIEMGRI